jgi:ribosomal protein S18 acetylase RimI-like enzyme
MAERPLQGRIGARARADYLVRPLRSEAELRAIMAPHRSYAAYALGQLQPRLFARSEWFVSRGAGGEALLLHSRGGLGNALFALGSIEALEALLRLHPGPRHTFLTCQVHHLPMIQRHYRLSERQSMARMLVDRETFRPVEGKTVRMHGRNVQEINRLYRSDGTPAYYNPDNIEDAVYFGTYEDGRLVSVAGTHVVSHADGIGVIGNVFTHPAYRNRRRAAVVTSAVTSELLATCREVVLSVDPRNLPAVRAYERLGYREIGRLIEGAAVRRDLGAGVVLRRLIAGLRGRRYGAELVSLRG